MFLMSEVTMECDLAQPALESVGVMQVCSSSGWCVSSGGDVTGSGHLSNTLEIASIDIFDCTPEQKEVY